MLPKIAFVLLVVWLIGVLGVFDVGVAIHVLLLVGLMLLLLGFVRARTGALPAGQHPEPPPRRR